MPCCRFNRSSNFNLNSLLLTWHCTDTSLWCIVGLTGAEDSLPAPLTCSLSNSTVNTPMHVLGTSVKPVLLSFLTWFHLHCKLHRWLCIDLSSDCRFNRWLGVGLTGAANFSCFYLYDLELISSWSFSSSKRCFDFFEVFWIELEQVCKISKANSI